MKYAELVSIFESEAIFQANVMYLEQHGLLDTGYENEHQYPAMRWSPSQLYFLRITNKGIDFLLADGGLSAILGIKTIKIHNEPIEKLTEIIQNADLAPEEKQKISELIKEKGTEAVISKLIDSIANNGGSLMNTVLKCFISSAM
ncbi:TPA: hypothetical protein ACPUE9_001293 [Proteus mirabilis]|uniref:hypothetical protein n=1 Tax=Proteus mirabilis TaxID=584 RepID=UPI000F5D4071|nr:hypothetical protein [Proteus mirabilis]AZG99296.1 hypothetical protein EHQ66_12380 [Proteus mirabilis]MCI9767219.1 hypothetical protein [Proteus mirabilis]MCI9770808.1 hypothetical protein [Proteus mirabilis]MCI9774401.1 hypothetical protein [Proteus mirabilis]MDM3648018.1 hypothetical protein [Proteus mirabilis]